MEVVRELVAARPSPVRTGARSLRYAWVPGTLFRYDFVFQQEMALSVKAELTASIAKSGHSAPAAQGADGRMSIDAGLLVHVYEAGERGAIVGYRLESPTVDFQCSGQPTTPQMTTEMGRRLGQEVLVRVTPRGEVLELRFAPDTAARERNMMKSILALVRIVLPEGNEQQWQAREEDSLGPFEGRYSASTRDTDGAVKIRKAQRYIEVQDGATDPRREGATKATMDGEVVATLAADAGVLVEVTGKETSELQGKDLAYDCHTTLSVSMRLAAIERHAADTAWASRFGSWNAAGPGREGEDDAELKLRAEQEKQEARKVSFDQLLEALDLACHAGDINVGGQEIGLRLATLFRGDDGAVARALALVRDARGHETGAVSTLVFALARAGTPAAQDALVAIVQGSEIRPELRHEAVLAAAQIESPRPELLEGLERQLDAGHGSSDSTTLALLEGTGIAAFKAAARGDHERAEAMAGRLEQELAASTDPRRARAALVGLGNVAQGRSLPSIEGRLRDDNESVRAAAVGALRRMPESQARPLLERVAREDASEHVRASARTAMEGLGQAR